MAPKFAGLIMGFANSLSTLTGILSTVLATVVVHYLNAGVGNGWIFAMCLAAGSQLFAAVFFIAFASSQEQAWAKGGPSLQEPSLRRREKKTDLEVQSVSIPLE
ncbi:unnamed protein product [Schistocephalus solidus]|uniref:Inorganic phosphate cotransporter n=1 Tax=Schistocephalus solidus TaxID=70667 RepID=A0A3P7CXR6_SCHSO|nr:unnamed protein product [Schistocephalus solidus]